MEDLIKQRDFWKNKYMDLANQNELLKVNLFRLQLRYNAAAKQANMHPLLQEPKLEDIDPYNTGGDITPDTKWGDLDPDLEKLDRKKANERVEF
jgi:hypothetical protein